MPGRTYTAYGAAAAVQAHVEAQLADDAEYVPGTYVAVPRRSWRPVTPKIETQLKVRV